MTLESLLEIKKGDIVTVVGAGGKTSLINYLIKVHSSESRVLLSTTTKIYLPKESDYNNKIMLTNERNTFIKKGVTLYGKYINDEQKVVGASFKDLDNIIKEFDYSFIEGDGSKRKKLKGWNENEPLVYPKTTKNIGVLDISSYG
ncbi:MAG: selenium cofactor biosynthesis protein YqeC, partial [Paraclostridium sp.]